MRPHKLLIIVGIAFKLSCKTNSDSSLKVTHFSEIKDESLLDTIVKLEIEFKEDPPSNEIGYKRCTAFYVSPVIALTAAHCLHNAERIYLKRRGKEDVQIFKFNYSKAFNGPKSAIRHDIGMLRIPEFANPESKFLKMAKPNTKFPKIVSVFGYGGQDKTDILQEGKSVLKSRSLGTLSGDVFESTGCLACCFRSGPKKISVLEPGDSGGPMMETVAGKPLVRGINSCVYILGDDPNASPNSYSFVDIGDSQVMNELSKLHEELCKI